MNTVILFDIVKYFSLFFVILCTVAAIYFKVSFSYWKQKNVPCLQPSFLFGNLYDVIFKGVSFGDIFKSAYDALKINADQKFAGFYIFSKPIFLAFDLDLVKSILIGDFDHFYNRSFYINEKVDPLSAHLFTLKDGEWKKIREKVRVIFTMSKLKMMFHTLNTTADGLLAIVQEAGTNNTSIDIFDLCGRYTNDAVALCTFGIELNALKNQESKFKEFAKEMLGKGSILQTFKLMISSFAPDLLAFFNCRFFSVEFGNYFRNMVRDTIEYREQNGVVRKDFMQVMIQLKNNVQVDDDDTVNTANLDSCDNKHINNSEKQGLTIDEITAEAIALYVGGYETSSTTISFCFLELSLNPLIQEKVRQEIFEVLNEHNGEICYDAIIKMNYLDCCVRETLRKYPPLPNLFRECNKDYKIPNSDIILEKGTLVFIPIKQLHYDSEYFPNPETFIPERFDENSSSENLKSPHICSWLPFGEGPRICIGLRFGMLQVKIALVKVLKDYRCSVGHKVEYPVKINAKGFTTTPLEKIYLKMEKL